MVSPNIHAGSILCANAQTGIANHTNNDTIASLLQPRTVYLGKEQYPIDLTNMEVTAWFQPVGDSGTISSEYAPSGGPYGAREAANLDRW